jgi:hypothetical protein
MNPQAPYERQPLLEHVSLEQTSAGERKILYIDLDNTLVDFRSALPRLDRPLPRDSVQDDLDDIEGIFALMDPMPGAIDAFHTLAGVYDTFILSTAPWKNPSAWRDKLLWVKRYLGAPAEKRLILSHHKHLNRGDYLVDDRPHARGADRFEGEVLAFGADKFETWPAVTEYLLHAAAEIRDAPLFGGRDPHGSDY